MVTPDEYDDVIVTVAHPYADIETTLRYWIETGPGPRPFVTITAARRSNGDPVPLEAIPLEYHNSQESRRLQRLGLLPAPWGPPPTDEPYTLAPPGDQP
jgi:hypothetical protein